MLPEKGKGTCQRGSRREQGLLVVEGGSQEKEAGESPQSSLLEEVVVEEKGTCQWDREKAEGEAGGEEGEEQGARPRRNPVSSWCHFPQQKY